MGFIRLRTRKVSSVDFTLEIGTLRRAQGARGLVDHEVQKPHLFVGVRGYGKCVGQIQLHAAVVDLAHKHWAFETVHFDRAFVAEGRPGFLDFILDLAEQVWAELFRIVYRELNFADLGSHFRRELEGFDETGSLGRRQVDVGLVFSKRHEEEQFCHGGGSFPGTAAEAKRTLALGKNGGPEVQLNFGVCRGGFLNDLDGLPGFFVSKGGIFLITGDAKWNAHKIRGHGYPEGYFFWLRKRDDWRRATAADAEARAGLRGNGNEWEDEGEQGMNETGH
jgi:hypothetical protein